MAIRYQSKTLFTYEADFPNALSPGASTEFSFNTHGDSDFFWMKLGAFALVDGAATSRTLDELPAVALKVTNQTTGRIYMNAPVPLPNFAYYGQFLPRMTVWPRKSSMLIELLNVDAPTVVTVVSGFDPDGPGIGSSGEDVEFTGWEAAGVPGGTGTVGSATPDAVNGQDILVAGVFSGFGQTVFYIVTAAGAADLFSQVTTELGAGPDTFTYLSSDALFLANGDSGSIGGIAVTATAGSTWLWLDTNGDFENGETTTLTFPGVAPPLTTYSLLQLSFIGAKAFPRV